MKLKLSFLGVLAILGLSLGATEHLVSVSSNVFTPSTLTITAGDTVTWNNTGGSHNVNGTTATFASNPASFGNGAASSASWTYSYTFGIAGTYNYQCDPHAGLGMNGTITVNPAPVMAMPCDKPFFSEYIEGSSNNKGFEIYNPSGSALNLDPYKVFLSGNGGSFTNELNITGSLASGDVFMVTTDQADPAIQSQADLALGFPSVAHFNGDDALFLVDTTTNDTLDIIGVIGVDPGSSWTVDTGGTQNYTLVRKASVTMGETDWSVASMQWDVYPQDTYNEFGAHISSCFAVPCTEPFFSEYIEGSSNNKGFEIYNPRQTALNLDPYKVFLSGNGGSFTNDLNITGTLASGDVFMVTTDQADPAIQNQADLALGFPSVAHFNGDDALFLVDTTTNDTLDIIGVIGVDPGSSWAVGTGSTQNHTLVRQATVAMGETDWSVASLQWDVFPQDTYTEFGSHTSTCVNTTPTNPTAEFTNSFYSVVEDSINGIVYLSVNPTQAADDTLYLSATGSAGLQVGVDGNVVPALNANGVMKVYVPANADSVSFVFEVYEDMITETNETLFVSLDSTFGGIQVGTMSSFTGVIIDDDQIFPEYDIATASSSTNGVADSLAVEMQITGVVYTDDFDGNNGLSFYIYDNTGGINVFNFNDVSNYNVTRGDSIRVIGEIDQFNGLIELFADSIEVLKTGVALEDPTDVSVLDESTEGEFIRMNNWMFADTSQWNPGGSFNVDITNGTDTFVMRVDSDIDLSNNPLPTTGYFDVIGAGSQYTTNAPPIDGYQIFPRDASDLIVTPMVDIADVTTSDSDGIADSLDAKVAIHGVVYTDDFDGNNGYSFYVYDNTGGINVFNFSDVDGYQVERGDSLMMIGEIAQFRGLTELMVEKIMILDSNIALKAPQQVPTLDESTEGEFIELKDWMFVDTAQWTTGSGTGGFNVDIYSGNDTVTMRIDSDIDLYNLPLPVPANATFKVRGAGSQFDFDSPYTTGYQIFPRSSADITSTVGIREVAGIEVAIYPNPARSQVNVITADNSEKVIRLSNLSGQVVREMKVSEMKTTISVSELPSGVYLLSISADDKVTTRKVIVE